MMGAMAIQLSLLDLLLATAPVAAPAAPATQESVMPKPGLEEMIEAENRYEASMIAQAAHLVPGMTIKEIRSALILCAVPTKMTARQIQEALT